MSTNGEVDPEAIADGMMTLLKERLDDPTRRTKIPDTVVAKFWAEANRMAERRKAEHDKQAAEIRDVLDIVQSSDIDVARKDLIVDAEVGRLETKIQLLRELKARRYEQRSDVPGEQTDKERPVFVPQPIPG